MKNNLIYYFRKNIHSSCLIYYDLYLKNPQIKETVCSCISTFVSSFFVLPVKWFCQIYQKYIPLYEQYTDKNNKILVQMSCTAYIMYTYHQSLHHANLIQLANLKQNRFFSHFFWLVILRTGNFYLTGEHLFYK